MIMKKVLLAVGLMFFAIVSCSDDDKPVNQLKLEGKWNFISEERIVNGTSEMVDLKPGSCDYDYYDLKADGVKHEVYHNENDDCANSNWAGTWSYNAANRQLVLIDDMDAVVWEIVSSTDSDLKLKLISLDGQPLPSGTVTYKYLKR